MAKDFVGLRLPADVLERIDHLAELQETTRTAVMERCLRMGLDEEYLNMDMMSNPITGPVLKKLLQPGMARRVVEMLIGEKVNEERVQGLIRASGKSKDRSAQAGKRKEV